MATGAGFYPRREAAPAHPEMADTDRRRRAHRRDDDRGPRGLEREGEARAGVAAGASFVAARFCGGTGSAPMTRRSPVGPTGPQGALRRLFRVPVYLYWWKCGWLLGHRFLLLNHTGRRTGLRRHA